MEEKPIVIELGKPSRETISLSNGASPKVSTALGEGVELLMNDKHKQSSDTKGKNVDIKNITSLEDELNSLSGSSVTPRVQKGDAMRLVIENDTKPVEAKPLGTRTLGASIPSVGKETAAITVEKSPFPTLLNIPIDPDSKLPEASGEE